MNVLIAFLLCLSVHSVAANYIILGADANTYASFTDGARSDAPTESFDTEITFKTKNAFGYEYRDTEPMSWGFALGFLQHEKSMVIGVKENDLINFDYDEDEVEIQTVYLDAIYRFEKFYLAFGFNQSQIKFESEDETLAVESFTSIGSSFAFGWELTNWVILEYGARTNPWVLKKTTSGGVTTDYGDGNIAVSTLQLKVRFW